MDFIAIANGIIVADDMHEYRNPNVRALVLEVSGQVGDGNHLYAIHKDSLHIPVEYKNSEIAFRKNLARRLAEPLLFGQTIGWADEHAGYIRRYKREAQMFPTRCLNGRSQIMITGVVNPEEIDVIWTSYFGTLSLHEECGVALPNILYYIWVNLSVDETDLVSAEFDDFEKMAPIEMQSDVGSAPWNENNMKYHTISAYPDSDSDDCYDHLYEKSQYVVTVPLELHGKVALATDSRTFYVEVMPKHVFKLALNPNIPLCVGSFYVIDASYFEIDKVYLVTNYRVKMHMASLPSTDKNTLLMEVRAVEGWPGIYQTEKFGFVDDPRGRLDLLKFSPFSRNAITVAVEDGGPACGGQFRFRTIELKDKTNNLSKWSKKEQIRIEKKVAGIVISPDRVFAESLSLIVHFREGQDVPEVGSPIKFSADYVHEVKRFVVTEFYVNKSAAAVPVVQKRLLKVAPHKLQYVFRVSAKAPVGKELQNMLKSDEFGFIDPCDKMSVIKKNTKYTVWVALSKPDMYDTVRPARTHFFVVSSDEKEPVDLVAAPTPSMLAVTRSPDTTIYDTDAQSITSNSKSSCSTFGSRFGRPVSRQMPSRFGVDQRSSTTENTTFTTDAGSMSSSADVSKAGTGFGSRRDWCASPAKSDISSSTLRSEGPLQPSGRFSRPMVKPEPVASQPASPSVIDNRDDNREQKGSIAPKAIGEFGPPPGLAVEVGKFKPTNDGGFGNLAANNIQVNQRQAYPKVVRVPKPIPAPQPNDNVKHHVSEVDPVQFVLQQERNHLPDCGEECAKGCLYVKYIARLIRMDPTFWPAMQNNHPELAAKLKRQFGVK